MNKIPVIFAIDNNYVKQLATAIVSILKNSSREIEFNILTSGISENNKEILSRLSGKINFIEVNQVMADFDLEKYMSRRKNYEYISIETYFRFFIPELFPQYEKVLYLDADILVLDDLSKLFDEDISDYYAGVVQDIWIVEHLQRKTKVFNGVTFEEYFTKKLNKTTSIYFNAGVLLLNLKKKRDDNVVAKLWKFTRESSPLHFQDQDVLNSVLENSVKYVDLRWNILKEIDYLQSVIEDRSLKDAIAQSLESPGIVHFVGPNKPWQFTYTHDYSYKYIKEWWDNYKLTPYFEERELDIFNTIINFQ